MQRLKATACCPACGAPFELLEGANVTVCPYCQLPLFFQSPKSILRYFLEPKVQRRSISFLVDRYRKEIGDSLTKRINEANLLYLPFWRYTAQAFYTIVVQPRLSSFPLVPEEQQETDEILTREWDINLAGHVSNDLGIGTLGMRPDWLNLSILTEMNKLKQHGDVLSLELDSKAAKDRAVKALNFYIERKKAPEDELVLKLIEERLSLIYFPLWTVDFLAPEEKFHQVIDAITGRVLKQAQGHFERKKCRSDDVDEFYPPQIVPHRCPNCGWDLPVKQFHVVYPCRNCGRIWKIGEDGYSETKGKIAKAKEETDSSTVKSSAYYPFWVFETKLQQGRGSSIEEVFKLLPSEIGLFSVKDKSRPFLFYIPAFELGNLKKIADIGMTYFRTQPQLEKVAVDKQELKGVLINEEDAKRVAELLWYSIISWKANLDPEKWKELKLESTGVVWCPCYKEGMFLRDAVVGYSYQKFG
jgi:DNA-directed RNA polymerase subunit RPC12/RpoP/ribosomal protein L37AE/L43A